MKAKFMFSLICVAAVMLTACEEYPYGYYSHGSSPYGYYPRYGYGGGYGYPSGGYGYGGGYGYPSWGYGGRLRLPFWWLRGGLRQPSVGLGILGHRALRGLRSRREQV